MAPNIRVDDDVYDLLKAHAEAFVDTPNSVLRKLLGLNPPEQIKPPDRATTAVTKSRPAGRARRSRSQGRTRAPKGSLLSEEAYVAPLLSALAERGGSAPVGEVIEAVGKKLADQLTVTDRESLPSGQTRWKNRAQFVRLRLVNQRLLAHDSPRGIWTITELGRSKLNGTAA